MNELENRETKEKLSEKDKLFKTLRHVLYGVIVIFFLMIMVSPFSMCVNSLYSGF